MDEENGSTPPVPVVEPAPAPAAMRPRRGGTLALLIALAALIVAGFALWRVILLERGQSDTQTSLRTELSDRLEALARATDQHKRDLDSLRSRVADADGVNKSMREELLSLGERSRHLEDAVANLAEQRLTGRDALALNEAEFLLQLAEERLRLFHDAQAAVAAYRLADSALAAAEDPVFAGVRQTIGAEIDAIDAAKPLVTHATLTELERVRASLATLPEKKPAVATQSTAAPSRFMALIGQFVRVSSDQSAAPGSRDVELARSIAAIDLRAAEAALLARDPDAYKAALARARVDVATGFDADANAVKDDLAALDKLAAAPLAPPVPELGSALRELRNLRATRALARPHDEVQPPAEPKTGDGAAQ